VHARRRCRRGGCRREKESLIRPAVFLDRDGTLVEEVGFLDSLDKLALYPWTVDTVRALNRAGLAIVVITNQSGIARGILTEAFVDQTHRRIDERLSAGAARIDAYYYCPHHPQGKIEPYVQACDCRKPRCGMIERASRELGLDPSRSFVVGDTWLDVGAARAAGARSILVRTRTGTRDALAPLPAPPAGLEADAIVDNLAAAASWILTHVDRA
jgi:D-glycero-D-manno-heptose 1,7-bisphosphate phosphatase